MLTEVSASYNIPHDCSADVSLSQITASEKLCIILYREKQLKMMLFNHKLVNNHNTAMSAALNNTMFHVTCLSHKNRMISKCAGRSISRTQGLQLAVLIASLCSVLAVQYT